MLLVVALLSSNCAGVPIEDAPQPETALRFSADRAYQHALAQCELGPRPTGSEANQATADYIAEELEEAGWGIRRQQFTYRNTPVENIIGTAGEGPVVLLGAHYDTRRRADQDPKNPNAPVLGGNDGASGVAVLLELAHALEVDAVNRQVWLAFFDAEDNGRLNGWDWIIGSSYMAQHLEVEPEFVVIVDMIGDKDQQIYYERNSDEELMRRIWDVAAELGHEKQFIPEYKWSITDDHTPFLRQGITGVDIIDFDYPYWHTTEDTCNKVGAASLERVGRTLEVFLEERLAE